MAWSSILKIQWIFLLALAYVSTGLSEGNPNPSSKELPWGDSEFNFAYEKIHDVERIIEVGPDFQHYLVAREKQFVARKSDKITIVTTTERRSGWPYLGQQLIESGIPEKEVRKLWKSSDPKRAMAKLRQDYGRQVSQMEKKLKGLIHDHDSYYKYWIRRWMEPVLEDYSGRKDWSEAEGKALMASAIKGRKRADWTVTYRRKDYQKFRLKSNDLIATIWRDRSQYARFFVKIPQEDGSFQYKSFTCRAGHCDTASLFRKLGEGSVHGLDVEKPVPLLVESMFDHPLPKLITPDEAFQALPASKRTLKNGIEIVQVGFGEIAEPRSLWIQKDTSRARKQTQNDYIHSWGESMASLLYFMSDPNGTDASRRHARNFAYAIPPQSAKSVSERERLNSSLSLFEKMNVVEERFPVAMSIIGESMVRFGFGTERMASLVRDPQRFSLLFQDIDPERFVESFLRKIKYDLRAGQVLSNVPHIRPFWDRDMRREYLKLLEKENLIDNYTEFSRNPEVTKFLRSDLRIKKARPGINALTLVRDIKEDFASEIPEGTSAWIYALEDAGVDWKNQFSHRRLVEAEAIEVVQYIDSHHGDAKGDPENYIGLDTTSMARDKDTRFEEITERLTGQPRNRTQFLEDVNAIETAKDPACTGCWYRFLENVEGVDSGKYRSHWNYSNEEIVALVKGLIKENGHFNMSEILKNATDSREKIHRISAEAGFERPLDFSGAPRLKRALARAYTTLAEAVLAAGENPKKVLPIYTTTDGRRVFQAIGNWRGGRRPKKAMTKVEIALLLDHTYFYIIESNEPGQRMERTAIRDSLIDLKIHPEWMSESDADLNRVTKAASKIVGRKLDPIEVHGVTTYFNKHMYSPTASCVKALGKLATLPSRRGR